MTEVQVNSHRININDDSVKLEQLKLIEYECREHTSYIEFVNATDRTLAEKTRMERDSHTRLVSKILEILRSEELIR